MKITIVTVCLNSAAVIGTALESVLRQTWPSLEYVVVDGGSVDGTLEIIRAYAPRFAGRMRWISEKDDGMYDAINKGIALATGVVVGILNADDVLADDTIVAQVAQAFVATQSTATKVDVVYGDIRFTKKELNLHAPDAKAGLSRESNQALLAQLRAGATQRYYSAKHWRPWMLQWGYMPPHPSVYIRRACFEELGGYATDYKIAADYALLIRYLRRADLRARYLPLCMVDMRTGGLSTRGWRSNLLLNQEIVRGNREAGYFCTLAMLVPKYLFKVWEFLPRRWRGL